MNRESWIDLQIASDDRTFTLRCLCCDSMAKLQANNPVIKTKVKDVETLKNFANTFKVKHGLCYIKTSKQLPTEVVNYIN